MASFWIEIAPPFMWKPRVERYGPLRGFLWAWFRVAHIRGMDINKFVQGIARAGVEEHLRTAGAVEQKAGAEK
jgi:hypothetical protein